MEMKIEERFSNCTMYLNEEKGRRVTVTKCSQGIGSKVKYFVSVCDVDSATGNGKNPRTVATRCDYETAMTIAKEEYFR